MQEESDILKIVRMVAARHYDPCIVFNFSKKECEALAHQASRDDLTGQFACPLCYTIEQPAASCSASRCKECFVPRLAHQPPCPALPQMQGPDPNEGDEQNLLNRQRATLCLRVPAYNALQMQGLDLNEDDEKKLVDGIFSSAVDCLSGEKRRAERGWLVACQDAPHSAFSC